MSSQTTQERTAFIGGGNMATSLVTGLLTDGRSTQSMIVSDPEKSQRDRVGTLGVAVTDDNVRAVADVDLVVLAVKPQVLGEVVRQIANTLRSDQLLLSIAAGVPSSAIARWLDQPLGVVRCMPNTPAMFGAGMSVLHANEATTPQQRHRAEAVMRAVGDVLWVDEESQLDAVTAVSGSGPAYFFYLMEAMVAAGTELGLEPSIARRLTLQTARGAAEMGLQSDDEPAVLRRNVTSPGGTTAAALAVFESEGLADTIRRALAAAAARSEELAAEFGQ